MGEGNRPDRLLSVVFSFRNEEENLPELLSRVRGVLDKAIERYELIFVNDASTDGSLATLESEAKQDSR